jgi:DNA (cytosine-5)-methyltransferase 1
MLRTMHLFAGVGGGLLADLILGHTPIVAVEWDGYACQVLRERAADGWFPELQVWEGDVRLFDPSEYAGSVDCIHAGFPCQDVSRAGSKKGVGPETRSGLYREVLRIAGVVRPQKLYLENVSAIVSDGLGAVLGDIASMGFDAEWGCIRASDLGAPHDRDRWFLIANANREWQLQQEGSQQDQRGRIGNCVEEDADTLCKGLERQWNKSSRTQPKLPPLGSDGWWATEPRVVRMVHGLPNRFHRIKGLGNAQVPLQAAAAWRLLGGV